MVIDLSADKPYVPYSPPPKSQPKEKEKILVAWPAEGQKYTFGAEPYWNAQIFFRDQADRTWPSYYGGKPGLGGVMTWSEEGPASVHFDVEFPHLLLNDGKPPPSVG